MAMNIKHRQNTKGGGQQRHHNAPILVPTSRIKRGFTLIELLAVMGIVVVVSSVVLANNSRFGGNILLQNLAYDIALSVRQAQVYGIAVRSFGASNFSAGFGVHFDISSPTLYALFADAVVANGTYDENELVESTTLGRGYKIKSLCATRSGPENCNYDTIDILFKRPEPDALITARDGSGQSCIENNNRCKESARIVIESPRGGLMSIVVEAVGQIRVQ